MTSEIKVNKVSDTCGSALVEKCGSNITLGTSGKTVRIACGASTVGMGRSGTVDWCSTIYTNSPGTITAVNGKGYFINTTSGAVTVTLPGSPSVGDIIAISDYAGTFATNAVTINNNGKKIDGTCGQAPLSNNNQAVTLVYADATRGWKTIQSTTTVFTGTAYLCASGGNATVTVGDYKTHIFTADGTFTVNSGSGPLATAEYLVIGSGGGGGGGPPPSGGQGGAGAGGFRHYASTPSPTTSPLVAPAGITLSPGAIPITVGAGGTGGTATPPAASNKGGQGNNSIFSTITSAGGGGGGSSSVDNPNFTGSSCGSGHCGASGSGSAYRNPSHPGFAGGTANVPPVSPPQGQPGGASPVSTSPSFPGSGGGGAGAAGGNGGPPGGGTGGTGSYIADPFVGPTAPSYGTPGPVSSTRYFSGGGGGGGSPPGAAGTGGGAAGGNKPGSGADGTANTGGGAGGGGNLAGGTGGSGIVMIRYRYQ